MRTVLFVAWVSCLAIGCGKSSSPPATVEDASTRSPDSGLSMMPRPDAAPSGYDADMPPLMRPDAGGFMRPDGAMLPMCDVGTVPSGLPAVSAMIVADDGASNAETGGDPTGVARFDKLTLYVPEALSGMLRGTMVTTEGTAWADFDGTNFRIQSNVMITIRRMAGGAGMERAFDLGLKGTYMVEGSELMLTNDCIAGAMSSELEMSDREVFFSATAGRLKLVLVIHSFQGDLTIALEGARSAT